MEKKNYVFPRSHVMKIWLQDNWMASGSVTSVSDQGLPDLDVDDTTLGWLDD